MGRREDKLIGRAWVWGAENLPQEQRLVPPRFALGTRDMERLTPDGEVADPTARDYAHIAAMPDAAIAIAPIGLVAEVNELALTLLGRQREATIGQTARRLLANIELTDLKGAVRFVPASTGAALHHRDGRAIAIDALLCPDARGAVLVVLRPVDKAQRGTLLEEDVAQIVHDIKNPLSTIRLEIELLDEPLAQVDHVALQRAVSRITRNLEFVDHLVHDLLDLCALECERFTITRSHIELRTLIERLIERIVPTRDDGRVRIDAPEPVSVDVDAVRIERVIVNFVHNALKYTPTHSNIVVSLAVQSDHVRVSVIDDGPGVSQLDRELIFDKYRRATSAARCDGSGLGLFVAKRIIEAHGGEIGVESSPGAGACFFFVLPLR